MPYKIDETEEEKRTRLKALKAAEPADTADITPDNIRFPEEVATPYMIAQLRTVAIRALAAAEELERGEGTVGLFFVLAHGDRDLFERMYAERSKILPEGPHQALKEAVEDYTSDMVVSVCLGEAHDTELSGYVVNEALNLIEHATGEARLTLRQVSQAMSDGIDKVQAIMSRHMNVSPKRRN